MVYPGSQVQWVVPCVMVQRDGRTRGPEVAAGMVEAAAAAAGEVAAEVFVMVTKTEWRGHEVEKVRSCSLCFHSRWNISKYSTSLWSMCTQLLLNKVWEIFLMEEKFSKCYTCMDLLWRAGRAHLPALPCAEAVQQQIVSNAKLCVVWCCVVYLHVGRELWQVAPDQPLAQTQENWFTSSTHVPPFRHGEDTHSLMSEWNDKRKVKQRKYAAKI